MKLDFKDPPNKMDFITLTHFTHNKRLLALRKDVYYVYSRRFLKHNKYMFLGQGNYCSNFESVLYNVLTHELMEFKDCPCNNSVIIDSILMIV